MKHYLLAILMLLPGLGWAQEGGLTATPGTATVMPIDPFVDVLPPTQPPTIPAIPHSMLYPGFKPEHQRFQEGLPEMDSPSATDLIQVNPAVGFTDEQVIQIRPAGDGQFDLETEYYFPWPAPEEVENNHTGEISQEPKPSKLAQQGGPKPPQPAELTVEQIALIQRLGELTLEKQKVEIKMMTILYSYLFTHPDQDWDTSFAELGTPGSAFWLAWKELSLINLRIYQIRQNLYQLGQKGQVPEKKRPK